eukprot:jgi/Galph1/2302/GphlegSOOS_G972.1
MEAEQEQVKERLSKWSRERLEREGVALFELTGKLDGELYGQGIAKFFIGNNQSLPFHRMTQGDLVLCIRGKQSIQGTVLERHRKYLRVVVGEEVVVGKDWKMYQISNTVAFERAKEAVHHMASMAEQENKEISQLIVKSFAKEVVESSRMKGDENIDAYLDSMHSSLITQLVTSSNQGSLNDLCTAKVDYEKPSCWKNMIKRTTCQLNESQYKVLLDALERRLTLIQGPPGTGKTKTLGRILACMVELGRVPILASAYTHIATDNLLSELHTLGIAAVRIGKPVNIHRDLWQYSLDSLLENDSRVIETRQKYKKAVERLSQPKKGKEIGLAHRDYSKALGELKQVEMKVTKELIEKHPVVLSTCVGAGEELLKHISFQVIAVDEATQSHEPGVIIPIARGCEQLILAGDHYQLPPTILHSEAAERGLAMSLFERLVRSSVTPHLLRTQYRMHPSIAEFPSQYFYHGLLKSAECTRKQSIASSFPWPNPQHPLAFIPICGQEETTEQGTSFINPQESSWIVAILKRLIDSKDNEQYTLKFSIGIITPYAGQMRDIVDRLEREMPYLQQVEVKTVDGFQGREKDIIIISTVRSNDSQSLGFVQDWRRLNVSITRSRCGLIVVGNEQTLQVNRHWRQWLQWMRTHHCVMNIVQNIGKPLKPLLYYTCLLFNKRYNLNALLRTRPYTSWLGPPADDKDIRHVRRIAKTLGKEFIDTQLTVALVGKPNVGKSSMFNRLVGKKLSLVDKTPGLTRDRLINNQAVLGNYQFTVIDTAGLEGVNTKAPKMDEHRLEMQSVASACSGSNEDAIYRYVYNRMEAQSKQAVAEADIIFFMVDVKNGITVVDREIAKWLLTHKPQEAIILIANKCDAGEAEENLPMVYSLGMGEAVKVSVEQMTGFYDLYAKFHSFIPIALREEAPKGPSDENYEEQRMKQILQELEHDTKTTQDIEEEEEERQKLAVVSQEDSQFTSIRDTSFNAVDTESEEMKDISQEESEETLDEEILVAFVGRPNVGKSTLVNRLIEEDRLITGAVQGITRDSVPVEWVHRNRRFILTDTAGIRRRSTIQVRIERFSMESALRTIRKSHVVLVVLDGSEHLTQQDARIIGFAIDAGRPIIIVANKWDLVDPKMQKRQRESLENQLHSMLPDLKGSPVFTLSAIDRQDTSILDTIGNAIVSAFGKWNKKIPTARLTEWLQTLVSLKPPSAVSSNKKRPKLAFLSQVQTRPPSFVLFGTSELPTSYIRFLYNGLRNEFDLHGVPIRLRLNGRESRVKK